MDLPLRRSVCNLRQDVYSNSNSNFSSPYARNSGPFSLPVAQPPVNDTFHDSLHHDNITAEDATGVTLPAGTFTNGRISTSVTTIGRSVAQVPLQPIFLLLIFNLYTAPWAALLSAASAWEGILRYLGPLFIGFEGLASLIVVQVCGMTGVIHRRRLLMRTPLRNSVE